MTMPVKTVINRFFVFAARIIQGMAASRAVLFNESESVPSGIKREGKRRADNTATGICLSQRITNGGSDIRVKTTRGTIRGN